MKLFFVIILIINLLPVVPHKIRCEPLQYDELYFIDRLSHKFVVVRLFSGFYNNQAFASIWAALVKTNIINCSPMLLIKLASLHLIKSMSILMDAYQQALVPFF
jgi:hypothetical protein